jgi:hypothetical protein
MDNPDLFDPDRWCALPFPERRDRMAAALFDALRGAPGVDEVRIEPGPLGRTYDLTAVAETDVGPLRTPLWSHARAEIFCDPSIHPANRRQLAPGLAVAEAAERLRGRVAVPLTLESRGVTVRWPLGQGIERVWSAERALFRGRTAVSREDRLSEPGEEDLRELLARHYTGPSLRVVSEDGTAVLLRGGMEEADGELVTLCRACSRWSEGSHARCPACGAAADTMAAHRPPRR